MIVLGYNPSFNLFYIIIEILNQFPLVNIVVRDDSPFYMLVMSHPTLFVAFKVVIAHQPFTFSYINTGIGKSFGVLRRARYSQDTILNDLTIALDFFMFEYLIHHIKGY